MFLGPWKHFRESVTRLEMQSFSIEKVSRNVQDSYYLTRNTDVLDIDTITICLFD